MSEMMSRREGTIDNPTKKSKVLSKSQELKNGGDSEEEMQSPQNLVRYISEGAIKSRTRKDNLKNVLVLDLTLREGEKKIKYIEKLDGLTRIQVLRLGFNQIQKIENLAHLVKLRELDLGCNCISRLEGLETLVHLQTLNVSSNLIETIPAWVGKKLKALRCLNIAANLLFSLSDIYKLRPLKDLVEFSIAGNPLCDLKHHRLFIVFHLRYLTHLDGELISGGLREEAKQRFAQEEIENFEMQLDKEEKKLRELEGDHNKSLVDIEKSGKKIAKLETKTTQYQEKMEQMGRELQAKDELLKRKMAELNKACHKQYRLEQEIAFQRIDAKFEPLGQLMDVEEIDGGTDEHMYIGQAGYKRSPLLHPKGSTAQRKMNGSRQSGAVDPEIQEKMNRNLDSQLADKEKQIQKAERKLRDIQNELFNAEEELDKSREVLESKQEVLEPTHQAEALGRIHEDLSDRQRAVSDLKDRVSQLEEDMETALDLVEEKEHELEVLREQLAELDRGDPHYVELQAQLADKDLQAAQAREEHEQLQQDLEDSLGFLAEELDRVAELEAQLRDGQPSEKYEVNEELQGIVGKLTEHLNQVKEQAARQKEDSRQLQRERDKLMEELEEAKAEALENERENDGLEQRLKDAEAALQELGEQKAALSEEDRSGKIEHEKQLERVQARMDDAQDEIQKLRAALQEKENQALAAEEKLKRRLAEREKRLRDLETDRDDHNKEEEALVAEIEALKAGKKKLEREKRDRDRDLDTSLKPEEVAAKIQQATEQPLDNYSSDPVEQALAELQRSHQAELEEVRREAEKSARKQRKADAEAASLRQKLKEVEQAKLQSSLESEDSSHNVPVVSGHVSVTSSPRDNELDELKEELSELQQALQVHDNSAAKQLDDKDQVIRDLQRKLDGDGSNREKTNNRGRSPSSRNSRRRRERPRTPTKAELAAHKRLAEAEQDLADAKGDVENLLGALEKREEQLLEEMERGDEKDETLAGQQEEIQALYDTLGDQKRELLRLQDALDGLNNGAANLGAIGQIQGEVRAIRDLLSGPGSPSAQMMPSPIKHQGQEYPPLQYTMEHNPFPPDLRQPRPAFDTPMPISHQAQPSRTVQGNGPSHQIFPGHLPPPLQGPTQVSPTPYEPHTSAAPLPSNPPPISRILPQNNIQPQSVPQTRPVQAYPVSHGPGTLPTQTVFQTQLPHQPQTVNSTYPLTQTQPVISGTVAQSQTHVPSGTHAQPPLIPASVQQQEQASYTLAYRVANPGLASEGGHAYSVVQQGTQGGANTTDHTLPGTSEPRSTGSPKRRKQRPGDDVGGGLFCNVPEHHHLEDELSRVEDELSRSLSKKNKKSMTRLDKLNKSMKVKHKELDVLENEVLVKKDSLRRLENQEADSRRREADLRNTLEDLEEAVARQRQRRDFLEGHLRITPEEEDFLREQTLAHEGALQDEIECLETTLAKRRAELREADRLLQECRSDYQLVQSKAQDVLSCYDDSSLKLSRTQEDAAELERRAQSTAVELVHAQECLGRLKDQVQGLEEDRVAREGQHEEAEGRLRILQGESRVLEEKIEALNDKYEQLQTGLVIGSQQSERHMVAIRENEKLLAEREAELAEISKKIDSKEAELEKLEKKRSKADVDLHGLTSDLDQHRHDLLLAMREGEADVSNKQEIIKDLKTDIAIAERQQRDLRKDLEGKRSELEQVRQDVEGARRDLGSLTAEGDKQRADLKHTLEMVQIEKTELGALKLQHEARLKGLEETQLAALEEKSSLEKLVTDTQKAMSALNQARQELERDSLDRDQMVVEKRTLGEGLGVLRREKGLLEAQHERLQESVDALRRQETELKDNVQLTSHQLDRLEQDADPLERGVKELKAKKQTLAKDTVGLQQKVKDAKAELKLIRQELKDSEKQNTKLEKELESLTLSRSKTSTELDGIHEKLDRSCSALEEILQQEKDARQRLQRLGEEVELGNRESEAARRGAEKAREEVDIEQKRLNNLLQQLTSKTESLHGEIHDRQRELADLEQTLEAARAETSKHSIGMQKYQAMEKRIQKLKTQLQEAEDRKKSCIEDLDMSRRDVENLKKENGELTGSIDRLNADVEKLRRKLKQAKQKYEQERQQLLDEISTITKEADSEAERANGLFQELNSLHQRHDVLQQQIADYEDNERDQIEASGLLQQLRAEIRSEFSEKMCDLESTKMEVIEELNQLAEEKGKLEAVLESTSEQSSPMRPTKDSSSNEDAQRRMILEQNRLKLQIQERMSKQAGILEKTEQQTKTSLEGLHQKMNSLERLLMSSSDSPERRGQGRLKQNRGRDNWSEEEAKLTGILDEKPDQCSVSDVRERGVDRDRGDAQLDPQPERDTSSHSHQGRGNDRSEYWSDFLRSLDEAEEEATIELTSETRRKKTDGREQQGD